MKISNNYKSITFHNELEMKVFVEIFFDNSTDIRERFIYKQNYYLYISGKDFFNYHINAVISGDNYSHKTDHTIYMNSSDDEYLLRKVEKEIAQLKRKDKLNKLK